MRPADRIAAALNWTYGEVLSIVSLLRRDPQSR